nr:MAG TPA: hypothetical protein [Crassvirales sp.]
MVNLQIVHHFFFALFYSILSKSSTASCIIISILWLMLMSMVLRMTSLVTYNNV